MDITDVPFDADVPDAPGKTDDGVPGDGASDAIGSGVRIRLMAANTSSGSQQSYQEPGIRIFQGLDPDIVLIQELNYGNNSPEAIRGFVDAAFGSQFVYYRQPSGGIPNGVISRYPIREAGTWDQPSISDREFVWARIDIPGAQDLWAISVHLKSGSASRRSVEATALVAAIQTYVPASAYLVVGGDFNTNARNESCLNQLTEVIDVAAARATDQNGDGDTNASRNNPYDWVLFDADLQLRAVPTVIGSQTHAQGLVFDSRVYTPLSEVVPIRAGDSGVSGMQHMAVVRDVLLR